VGGKRAFEVFNSSTLPQAAIQRAQRNSTHEVQFNARSANQRAQRKSTLPQAAGPDR
jgi:hypothetical protein